MLFNQITFRTSVLAPTSPISVQMFSYLSSVLDFALERAFSLSRSRAPSSGQLWFAAELPIGSCRVITSAVFKVINTVLETCRHFTLGEQNCHFHGNQRLFLATRNLPCSDFWRQLAIIVVDLCRLRIAVFLVPLRPVVRLYINPQRSALDNSKPTPDSLRQRRCGPFDSCGIMLRPSVFYTYWRYAVHLQARTNTGPRICRFNNSHHLSYSELLAL